MAKIRSEQIVSAAKAAYTPATIDYSGYVKAISAVNKFVMQKASIANDQETKMMDYEQEDFEGINTSILNQGNIDYLTNVRAQMAEDSKTMKFNLPFTKAYKESQKRWNDNYANLKQLKTDSQVFTTFVKKVKENKDFMSDYQTSLDQSFLTSILVEPDAINNSVRFTERGLQVLGADGNLILMEDLPSGTSIEDGSNIDTNIQTSINNIRSYASQGIYDQSMRDKVMHDLKFNVFKRSKSNEIGSAIFDYSYPTGKGMESYVDVVFEKNDSLKAAYEQLIKDSLSEDDPIDTDEEKELLRKKLIRDDLEGFDINKIKDSFLDWIEDKVFSNAELVARQTFKKKISDPGSKVDEFGKIDKGINQIGWSESGGVILKGEKTFSLSEGHLADLDAEFNVDLFSEFVDDDFKIDIESGEMWRYDKEEKDWKTFLQNSEYANEYNRLIEVMSDSGWMYNEGDEESGVPAETLWDHHRKDVFTHEIGNPKKDVIDLRAEGQHGGYFKGASNDDIEHYNEGRSSIHLEGEYSPRLAVGTNYDNNDPRYVDEYLFHDQVETNVFPKLAELLKKLTGEEVWTSDSFSTDGSGAHAKEDWREKGVGNAWYIYDDSSGKNSFKVYTPNGREWSWRFLTNPSGNWGDDINDARRHRNEFVKMINHWAKTGGSRDVGDFTIIPTGEIRGLELN